MPCSCVHVLQWKCFIFLLKWYKMNSVANSKIRSLSYSNCEKDSAHTIIVQDFTQMYNILNSFLKFFHYIIVWITTYNLLSYDYCVQWTAQCIYMYIRTYYVLYARTYKVNIFLRFLECTNVFNNQSDKNTFQGEYSKIYSLAITGVKEMQQSCTVLSVSLPSGIAYRIFP